jgi:hypothetical protein
LVFSKSTFGRERLKLRPFEKYKRQPWHYFPALVVVSQSQTALLNSQLRQYFLTEDKQ